MKILKTILLSIVVLFATNLQAAAPAWSINPNAYQYTMSVTATAKFNCEESTNPNNLIGAFINGNLAGFANINTDINGNMYAYITVYSNVAGGEVVTFKMYDSVNDTLRDSKFTTIFQENASIGNASSPVVQKTDYELEEISINTAIIFEYNQIGDSVVLFRAVNENMAFEVVDFNFINDTLGADNDHFNFVDSFLVMSQDVDYVNKDFYNIHVSATNVSGCSIDTHLLITVVNNNLPPTGFTPSETSIDENLAAGTWITNLVAIDESPFDEHTFVLSDDTVNFPDNLAFSIQGDSLVSNWSYDYETQNTYTLSIEVRDNLNNLFVDELQVNVNDLIEFDDLKVTNFITPNGDGVNDYFAIPNSELFREYTLMIFNDNGNNVYTKDGNYDNSWNGLTNKGAELPSATYYYTLQKGVGFNKFVGKITILRNSKF